VGIWLLRVKASSKSRRKLIPTDFCMWNLWLTATKKREEVEVRVDLAEIARVDA
jgi:hypothetical protein